MGAETVPTQALSPALWSTHETVQPRRRCREVESALKPRRETSSFGWFGHNSLDYCDDRMCAIGSRGCDSGVQVPFACLARGNRQLEPQYYQSKCLVALEFQHFILGELFNGILATLLCVR